MRTNLLPIAKEGIKYIFCSLMFFVLFGFLDFDFLQFFTFIATIFFIYVFRNPERELPSFQDGSVVAPCDGTISSIEELKDDEYAYKVNIDGSFFNVSLLRVPLTSTLEKVEVLRGARISKFNALYVDLNENATLIFKDSANNTLKVKHTLKQGFKPLDISMIQARKLNQGSRYGVMVNGITTLYLPKNFRLSVSVGAEINASQTLIGYFTK
jgi:phosphatidylserine decarboxylase